MRQLRYVIDRYSLIQGPLLSAGTVTISIEFQTTITAIAKISGYYLLVVGATGYVT
jgi:hypothetical protein